MQYLEHKIYDKQYPEYDIQVPRSFSLLILGYNEVIALYTYPFIHA